MVPNLKFLYSAVLGLGIIGAGLNYVGMVDPYLITSGHASEVTTLIVKTPAGTTYEFTAGSASLPRSVIKTHTAWTEGVQEFSGVSLKTLLEAAGIDEKTGRQSVLKARALNDYEVDIPGQDAYDFDVLVADQMNGAAMPVTEFGPFWIVYPRDTNSELQDSRFDHRWAWQLSELTVQ
ncbi:molybdopterin-dependent oxidoreductase [Brucellaceae bacterium C25G]